MAWAITKITSPLYDSLAVGKGCDAGKGVCNKYHNSCAELYMTGKRFCGLNPVARRTSMIINTGCDINNFKTMNPS